MMTDIPLWIRDMHILPLLLQELRWIPEQVLSLIHILCIRNTGEKTLHSVLSTERFLNANIQAQFMPKEGVTLNSTRTQALISSIAPGEALGLYAVVTIPQYRCV